MENRKNVLIQETTDDYQGRLARRIYDSLQSKGALVDTRRNADFWQREWGISAYSAPEQSATVPGGRATINSITNEPEIYLNPDLFHAFKPDYQLLTILEEAIHWRQLRRGIPVVKWEQELEASQKLLRITDHLRLSPERTQYLNEVMNYRVERLRESRDVSSL